ncbi:hypothetical protein LCGC14_2997820 [marine sediment metagenome]|uniref:Uncharacterized protein n=1 Tax=marine sediment metagenome TaxID=412755 RepID=A0A0F8Z9H0_9ZZZZ
MGVLSRKRRLPESGNIRVRRAAGAGRGARDVRIAMVAGLDRLQAQPKCNRSINHLRHGETQRRAEPIEHNLIWKSSENLDNVT